MTFEGASLSEKLRPLVSVWIEPEIEPRWFGMWHRIVYYVCTEFSRQGPHLTREAAEENQERLRSILYDR